MSKFWTFLQIGFEHIADLQAYDHMLFVITLCALYKYTEWKKIVVMVTAFTIGHSLTLAASVLEVIRVDMGIVELLIPVTIMLTALYNVLRTSGSTTHHVWTGANYWIALCFGFVHGMGFSNYLKSITSQSSELVGELFAFNVGLEFGQLLIVLLFFLLYALLSRLLRIQHRDWNHFWSGGGFAVALTLILDYLVG